MAAVTGGVKKQRSVPGEQDAMTAMSSAVCSLEDVLQLLQLLYALSVDIRMENSDFGRFHCLPLVMPLLCNLAFMQRLFKSTKWLVESLLGHSYFIPEAPSSKWLLGGCIDPRFSSASE